MKEPSSVSSRQASRSLRGRRAARVTSSGLRFRLREATAEAHQALETSMALGERCSDRNAYGTLLGDLWGVYVPLEAALARVDWASTGLDFQQRIKAQWLRADLTSLGVPEQEIAALPQLGAWPSLASPADAMGALYVLEGATLGGRVIVSQLASELGVTAQSGAQFFASYGVETGAKWRDFLAALAPFEEVTSEAARVEQAAQATFACFLGWVRARQASRLVARGRTHVRQ